MNVYFIEAAAADRHAELIADATRHRRAREAATATARIGRPADSWTMRWHLPHRRATLAGC